MRKTDAAKMKKVFSCDHCGGSFKGFRYFGHRRWCRTVRKVVRGQMVAEGGNPKVTVATKFVDGILLAIKTRVREFDRQINRHEREAVSWKKKKDAFLARLSKVKS